ncbi:LysR family transcriptional regulator [Cellvibrio polysaccharolyticus]|uniref:HTH-type transcriptional regulator MetR n=1 Tax=Cellvibrio polysaccharolyticus TaxID=2082724 RepID=A0A928YUM6_9GAMM|nr:LysR family transcriptional regulator [Cellvibrio polysaccharolyticus]MBE8718137.1 LysR family transcriptional regulator [Cellvibrio polysaccharolyticus]
MIEIRHLKTLIALRETGSLVDAAERLFLTQSALSHQLKELEGRLGTELFIRKSRPLRFTEAGKRVLLLADDVLAKVSEAERDVHKLLHGEAGRLYMAIECHSCFNWLMPTVDVYRNQWPSIELDFSSGFMFEPLPALAQGEIDLVITSDPQDIKGVEYIPLFSYEMQIAIANSHPLHAKNYLEPGDLADQTIITYPVERSRLDVFKNFLDPAGIEPAGIRTSELTLMMVQLVVSGRGVCALPNWVLAEYVDQALISVRAAGAKGIWPTLYAAVREEQLETPFIADFLKLAKAHCLKNLTGVKQV